MLKEEQIFNCTLIAFFLGDLASITDRALTSLLGGGLFANTIGIIALILFFGIAYIISINKLVK